MDDLKGFASHLVNDLISAHQPKYGLGTMTCAVYDTAWLSMVAKPAGSKNWLFPSTFSRVLDTQKIDLGGWMEPEDTDTDIILNTAAALLALCKHRGSDICPSLNDRITVASGFLRKRLQMLDLSTREPLPVGFELLLPTLLDLLDLEKVDGFSSIYFPARKTLLDARARKLARIDIDKILAAGRQSTLLHSLEAFTGRVDFDRFRGHMIMGSMMASPAATAALLINSTGWNDASEQYLRHVMEAGCGNGNGSVPSAFPSTYFEISWVIGTLLESGFSLDDLGRKDLNRAKQILEEGFNTGSRTIGFARHLESDADDTARGLTVLNLLGVPTPADPLLQEFYNGSYFITYERERDASITTNCNALTALCVSHNARAHVGKIETTMRFICEAWWRNTDCMRDKWNTSTSYVLMLTAQSLVTSTNLWARGLLPQLSSEVVETGMIVLLQILVRLLSTQSANGQWEGKRETTAYSVLALSAIASLPMVRSTKALSEQIGQAIGAARCILSQELASLFIHPPEHLWIEKVTYGSRNLSRAYILAALKTDFEPTIPGLAEAEASSQTSGAARIADIFPTTLEDVLKTSLFFKQLPMLSKTPDWCLHASLIQGALFKRRLHHECLRAFPQCMGNDRKHISFIPFTWTCVNNLHRGVLGLHTMFGMMVISALAYQVDEFIETELVRLSNCALATLKTQIGQLITSTEIGTELHSASQEERNSFDSGLNTSSAITHKATDTETTDQGKLFNIRRTIMSFIRYVLDASDVRNTTAYNRAQLKLNMRDYLVAHISQTEDSRRLLRQRCGQDPNDESLIHSIIEDPGYSLLTWTRSTSGDHTVGSLAVSVLICLLGSLKDCEHDSLASPQAKYVTSDMARHLAAAARLYNDLGSLPRDQMEGNLNSANFPEFRDISAVGVDEGIVPAFNKVKAALFSVAEYEKRCLESTMAELRGLVEDDIFAAFEALCAATKMYCEMYLLRDMTAPVKR